MNLPAAVKRYLEVTGGFDLPLHLSRFGLTKAATEQAFSAWDEDYQISRYMLLTRQCDEELGSFPSDSRTFLINGVEVSHVTFHADIQKML